MVPQVIKFVLCQFEQKVFRKSIDISPHSTFQLFRFYSIQVGKILVKQYFFPADDNDLIDN